MKIEINVTENEIILIRKLLELNKDFESFLICKIEPVLKQIVKEAPKRSLLDVLKEKQLNQ